MNLKKVNGHAHRTDFAIEILYRFSKAFPELVEDVP